MKEMRFLDLYLELPALLKLVEVESQLPSAQSDRLIIAIFLDILYRSYWLIHFCSYFTFFKFFDKKILGFISFCEKNFVAVNTGDSFIALLQFLSCCKRRHLCTLECLIFTT